MFSVNRQTDDGGELVGWGYYVIIQTGPDEFHLDAHLQENGRIEHEGENGGLVPIDKGDKIGKSGTSGNASNTSCETGPSHLHYEVREGDSWTSADPVDPEAHLGTKFNDDGDPISDSCAGS